MYDHHRALLAESRAPRSFGVHFRCKPLAVDFGFEGRNNFIRPGSNTTSTGAY